MGRSGYQALYLYGEPTLQTWTFDVEFLQGYWYSDYGKAYWDGMIATVKRIG